MRMSSGLSDTEVKEFAVMPCTWPGARSAVTTVTPVANWPRAWRKSEVLGVVGAIVEVFEDNTDAAQGRVLVSRIIIANNSREGVHDGADHCDFRRHRTRGIRAGETAGARGRAHRHRLPRSVACERNGTAAPQRRRYWQRRWVGRRRE